MSVHTVSYYHNYDKEKIEELESDPNFQIISRRDEIADTIHILPLPLKPSAYYLLYRTTFTYRKLQSPRQDVTSTPGVGQTPRTRGGNSFRGAKSPQTLKPFWSEGKPKCREGYRYDFKRKMCVISHDRQ